MEAWNNFVDRISEWFDFDDGAGRIQNYAPSSIPTCDGEALRNLVPYRTYDEESELFFNDNSYGFVLELAPLVGGNDQMITIISQTLASQLPEKSWVSIIDHASNRVGNYLDAWELQRHAEGGLLKKVAEHRTAHLKKAIHKSLYDKVKIQLFDYRIMLCVAIEGRPKQIAIDRLMAAKDAIHTSFKQAGIDNIPMKPERLLAYTREILGASGEDTQPQVDIEDSLDLLNIHAVEDNQKLRQARKRLIMNEGSKFAKDIRCLSVKKRPKMWPQWQNQRLIGDMYNDTQRLPCPTVFVTVFQVMKQEAAQHKMFTKVVSAQKKSEQRGLAARLSPTASREAQEAAFVTSKLNDGEKLVQMYQQVIVQAPIEDGNRCTEQVKNLFDSAGWQLKEVPFLQLQSFLTAIPFTLSEGLGRDMHKVQRLKRQLSWSIANLAQMQGEWKGDDWNYPLMLMIGRRGQPLNFNPFLNQDGNYNVAVVGKSGSGKSVFMNELSQAVLGIGGRDFTIDIGGSYKHACHLFKGTYIDVSENLSLNPFSSLGPHERASTQEIGEYWSEVKSMIANITLSMCCQRSDPTDAQETTINTVVHKIIDRYGNKASFTLIHQELCKLADAPNKPDGVKSTIHELAAGIEPYTEAGQYGQFFNGECNVDFTNRYVVLETERFESMGKRMLQVAIKLLMYHITDALYLGDRSTPTLVKIDEGWKMLESRDSAFIEDVARRVRKYMGSLVTGTQSVEDYQKSAQAKACWEQSDYNVLLAQKSQSMDTYCRLNGIEDSGTKKLIKSVKRNGEYYAEALICSPNGTMAVGRLILDHFSVAAFSTKGVDYTRVTWLSDKLSGIEEALDVRAKERILIMEHDFRPRDAELKTLTEVFGREKAEIMHQEWTGVLRAAEEKRKEKERKKAQEEQEAA